MVCGAGHSARLVATHADVHIKNRLCLRQGGAITNFDCHLPTPHAQLAIEALEDPYLFDFLGLGDEAGRLLCKTKNRLVAEYALSGISKPISVAEYQLVRSLLEPLDTNLPSIEEIEAELSRLPTDQADEEDGRYSSSPQRYGSSRMKSRSWRPASERVSV